MWVLLESRLSFRGGQAVRILLPCDGPAVPQVEFERGSSATLQIEHAGNQAPAFQLRCSRSRLHSGIEGTTQIRIRDAHVHREMTGPLLRPAVLRDEGASAEVHPDASLAEGLWLKAGISKDPLADLKILGRHHWSYGPDRVRNITAWLDM